MPKSHVRCHGDSMGKKQPKQTIIAEMALIGGPGVILLSSVTATSLIKNGLGPIKNRIRTWSEYSIGLDL